VAAHSSVLSTDFENVVLSGLEHAPGVRIGRRAVIHATARLVPPVWIGPWARIEAGATVGPNAVVCEGGAVDSGSSVTNAVVGDGTYLGPGLHLEDSVAVKDLVVNARLGGAARPENPILLADMNDPRVRRLIGLVFERAFAVAGLILGTPLVFLAALTLTLTRRGRVLWRQAFDWLDARKPRDGVVLSLAPLARRQVCTRRDAWKDFFLYFVPGLASVARGDLSLVGVTPRSASELAALPPTAAGVAAAKPGLVNEALIQGVSSTDTLGALMADLMQMADARRRSAPRALARYLSRGIRR